jgi:hypothetical protein
MTTYVVAIREEGEAEATARSTDNMDDALDWFTNAATEVMDQESEVTFASFSVDGALWGVLQEGGINPPDGEAEPVPARLRRVA